MHVTSVQGTEFGLEERAGDCFMMQADARHGWEHGFCMPHGGTGRRVTLTMRCHVAPTRARTHSSMRANVHAHAHMALTFKQVVPHVDPIGRCEGGTLAARRHAGQNLCSVRAERCARPVAVSTVCCRSCCTDASTVTANLALIVALTVALALQVSHGVISSQLTCCLLASHSRGCSIWHAIDWVYL